MTKRATFQSVKTDDPDLFVVKVSGHLGTRERKAVDDLLRRCRETGKHKVVFDFAEIESLGGGVAKALGEFAHETAAQGHPPCFVGASSVVQSFLTARFGETIPRFAADLEAARTALENEPAVEAAPRPARRAESVTKAAAPNEEAAVDEVSNALETLTVDELLAETDDGPGSGSALPPNHLMEEGVTRRHSYLTLADAQPMLQELADLRSARPILEGLLHGADLADVIQLFVLEGDRLIEDGVAAGATARWIPAAGEMCAILQRRAGPVDIVDLAEADLAEQESDVLTDLNSQIVVPVFVDEQMEGVFFVRKAEVGEEYVSSEELALDLLARQVGQDLNVGRRRQRGEVGPEEKKLRGQVRRQRTVLRLCRELHSIREEEQLLSRLLIALIGEMGVAGAIYLQVEGTCLVPRHCYGIDEANIEPLEVPDPQRVGQLESSMRTENADPETWGEAAQQLSHLGVDVVIPMRGAQQNFGLLALAARRSQESGNFDPDYVQAVIHQAAVAVDHARSVQRLEDQTLRVAKTLIALVEARTGAGNLASSDLITYYVARVAERLNYDKDLLRDLLYGAVLRDIGMIEISDLVLKSPRNLTPEEWKLVQRHPISGVEILRAMDFSDVTCDVVLHHHERFNGEGYPHRLRGTAIPQGARIVSVVESYVTMIRETPYRPALSREEAVAVLEENWEMRYDPMVIETFAVVLREQPAPDGVESGVGSLLTEVAAD